MASHAGRARAHWHTINRPSLNAKSMPQHCWRTQALQQMDSPRATDPPPRDAKAGHETAHRHHPARTQPPDGPENHWNPIALAINQQNSNIVSCSRTNYRSCSKVPVPWYGDDAARRCRTLTEPLATSSRTRFVQSDQPDEPLLNCRQRAQNAPANATSCSRLQIFGCHLA